MAAAKSEGTYGTPETLAGADAFLIKGFAPPQANADKHERMKGDTSLAPNRHVVGARRWDLNLETELKAHGSSATTAPEIGPLLIASGMTENTTTDVTYTPNSAFKGGCTVGFYQDGTRYLAAGCVFNPTFSWEAGGIFNATFAGPGLYNARTDASFLGSLTYDAEQPDAILGASLTIGGTSGLVIKSFTLTANNQIANRKDANSATGYAGFQITARQWSGSIVVEDELVADKDYIALALAGTAQAITFSVGSGTGSTVTVTLPAAILDVPAPGDEEGICTFEIPFTCYESALGADDEVDITFA